MCFHVVFLIIRAWTEQREAKEKAKAKNIEDLNERVKSYADRCALDAALSWRRASQHLAHGEDAKAKLLLQRRALVLKQQARCHGVVGKLTVLVLELKQQVLNAEILSAMSAASKKLRQNNERMLREADDVTDEMATALNLATELNDMLSKPITELGGGEVKELTGDELEQELAKLRGENKEEVASGGSRLPKEDAEAEEEEEEKEQRGKAMFQFS